MGGKRHGELDKVEGYLLASVKRSHDITMPDLLPLFAPNRVLKFALNPCRAG